MTTEDKLRKLAEALKAEKPDPYDSGGSVYDETHQQVRFAVKEAYARLGQLLERALDGDL